MLNKISYSTDKIPGQLRPIHSLISNRSQSRTLRVELGCALNNKCIDSTEYFSANAKSHLDNGMNSEKKKKLKILDMNRGNSSKYISNTKYIFYNCK